MRCPCYDPVSHLVHVAGRERVTDVWVGGERIVATRALATLDESARRSRARALWQRTSSHDQLTRHDARSRRRTPTPPSSRSSRRSRIAGGIPESEFRPLHEINPLRLDWIERRRRRLAGKRVLDVGCGGGILAEAMAARGARVTGIDLSEKALGVAQLHKLESGIDGRLSR